VDSEYNTRRKECESGVKLLQKHYAQVKSLRDVSPEMLEQHRPQFQGKVYNRCLYVVEEILRVQKASEDLDKGNLKAFGQKMFQTHDGLSHLYEVSCKELDFLVAEAKKSGQVLGARMMGGGFGGCTINLVMNDLADAFIREMQLKYKKAFSIEMEPYRVKVVQGTSRVADEDLAL
jgi:galactokinase